MGLFSSKKSVSSPTTNNTQIDQRAVGDNGATVISGDVTGGLTITDGDAIDGAFSFLEKADTALTSRWNSLLQAGDKIIGAGTEQASTALDVANAALKTDASPNRDFMMMAAAGAAVVAVAYFLGR